jgi:hypothetical protein
VSVHGKLFVVSVLLTHSHIDQVNRKELAVKFRFFESL